MSSNQKAPVGGESGVCYPLKEKGLKEQLTHKHNKTLHPLNETTSFTTFDLVLLTLLSKIVKRGLKTCFNVFLDKY